MVIVNRNENEKPLRKTRLDDCAHCGTEFKSEWRSGRDAWSKFCTRSCYNKNRAIEKFERPCGACGKITIGPRNKPFCGVKCGREMVQVKYSDNEIIYLASINPGYGFSNFRRTVYSTKSKNPEPRILDIFQRYKDETGVDLYGLIQDPSKMKRIPVHKYMQEYGNVPRGSGGGKGGSTGVHTIIRTNQKMTGRFVKSDKHLEFNWGSVEQI